jgi:hypothetical protein
VNKALYAITAGTSMRSFQPDYSWRFAHINAKPAPICPKKGEKNPNSIKNTAKTAKDREKQKNSAKISLIKRGFLAL